MMEHLKDQAKRLERVGQEIQRQAGHKSHDTKPDLARVFWAPFHAFRTLSYQSPTGESSFIQAVPGRDIIPCKSSQSMPGPGSHRVFDVWR